MFHSRIPSTPLNIDRLRLELVKHPDKKFVSYVIKGLQVGFDTLIPNLVLPNKECKNLLSARNSPGIIDELLSQEVSKGYLYGPFWAASF